MSTSKGVLTLQDTVAKECGRLVTWYFPIIVVGLFFGWVWAFVALTALYVSTLVALWTRAKQEEGRTDA